MRQRRDIFTGIVLGSDVIRVAMASFEDREDPSSTLQVRGYAKVPSLKIRRDEPENPGIVTEQLVKAMQEAWNMAACEGLPGNLSLCISGAYVHKKITTAKLELDEKQTITEDEVSTALHMVYQGKTSWDLEPVKGMVCCVPLINRGFRLADGRLRLTAVGQVSSSLTAESFYFPEEAEVHEKIDAVVSEALPPHSLVSSVVYAPIALSSGIFAPSMTEECSRLAIDLGAGMTSYVMLSRYGAVACGQIPVGLDHVVNDLAIALGVQLDTARKLVEGMERIRCSLDVKQDGNARQLNIQENLEGSQRHIQVCAAAVEMVMEARIREIFQLVRETLEKEGSYMWVGNEIVLTGPGARLPQIGLVVGKVFPERKVSIGVPYRVRGRDGETFGPEDAIMMGLLRASCRDGFILDRNGDEDSILGKLKTFWKSVRDW
ncbi:MAG: hypothetical protein ACI4SG_06475 [Oligosphaeraceae bacterium]